MIFDSNEIQNAVDQMPEGSEIKRIWQGMQESQKRKMDFIRQEAESGNLSRALALTDSQNRAPLLVTYGSLLSDDELRDVLRDYWSVTEAWAGIPRLRDGMLALLNRVAPVKCDPNNTLPDQERLTIYRWERGEDWPVGNSWTLERDIAERLSHIATSIRGIFLGISDPDDMRPLSIWQAEVETCLVLGYFDDRDEKEVVVDVADLLNIRMVAQAQISKKGK